VGSLPLSVSVVIPAYNAAATIQQAVRAARDQKGLPQPPEVIVVDDGSSDATAELAAAAGADPVIRQPNAGPAAARNKGFRAARAPYVLFTDSDCIPAPNWAVQLVEALQQPGVGAAGGSYTMANDGWIAAGIHWEIVARHRRFGQFVRAAGSYNLAIRREVMEAVGGFDESYPTASGEDNDLSYRIGAAGYKLAWVRGATVAHHHTNHLWKYLREQTRHGYYRVKLWRRHSRIARDDDYTRLKDAIEPVLVVLLLLTLAVSWLPWGWLAPLAVLVTLLGIQLPTAWRMLRASGRPVVLLHIPVMFLRAFARTFGFLSGLGGVAVRSGPSVGVRSAANR
jgi:glycosyltransferase involved in cell wall biosynthesis